MINYSFKLLKENRDKVYQKQMKIEYRAHNTAGKTPGGGELLAK